MGGDLVWTRMVAGRAEIKSRGDRGEMGLVIDLWLRRHRPSVLCEGERQQHDLAGRVWSRFDRQGNCRYSKMKMHARQTTRCGRQGKKNDIKDVSIRSVSVAVVSCVPQYRHHPGMAMVKYCRFTIDRPVPSPSGYVHSWSFGSSLVHWQRILDQQGAATWQVLAHS